MVVTVRPTMNVGLEHCAGRAAPPRISGRAAEAMLVCLIYVLDFHALRDFAMNCC